MTTLTYISIGIVIGYIGYRVVYGNGGKNILGEKEKRNQKILGLLETKDPNPSDGQRKITNKDIQKLLKVSDSTAVRYLDQLEKAGKVKQVGKTGHHTYYIKI